MRKRKWGVELPAERKGLLGNDLIGASGKWRHDDDTLTSCVLLDCFKHVPYLRPKNRSFGTRERLRTVASHPDSNGYRVFETCEFRSLDANCSPRLNS